MVALKKAGYNNKKKERKQGGFKLDIVVQYHATPEHEELVREEANSPLFCSQETKSSVGPKMTGPNSHKEAMTLSTFITVHK